MPTQLPRGLRIPDAGQSKTTWPGDISAGFTAHDVHKSHLATGTGVRQFFVDARTGYGINYAETGYDETVAGRIDAPFRTLDAPNGAFGRLPVLYPTGRYEVVVMATNSTDPATADPQQTFALASQLVLPGGCGLRLPFAHLQ